jgi:8-oxo-dGTP pyrophosphatase MutT (NUDIX family)
LFLAEGYDSVKKEMYYRPLGGAIEFGEYGRDCIIREIREEMHTEITELTYLYMMENIFVCDGKSGHEIVLVYEAKFVDPHSYEVESLKLRDNGDWFTAIWKSINYFREGNAPLYPEGLLELLDKKWK